MLIVFRYAQPLLMSRILQLLAANALGGQSYQLSCTVVVISSVVYVGQAKIFSSRYQHRLNRLKVMTRATLVELIYEKTLSMPATAYNDYSATTLMSTDVDALTNVSEMFHEAWAQVLEVIVGMVLLAKQIGWFCLVPLPLIYGCSHMTRYVARNLHPKQLAWNKATQDRINRVVSVVGKIKTIKMLGLGTVVRDQIGCLRQTEIDASKDMRWVAVLANASANALGLFTPAITIILFAAINQSNLDAETAYTTLAILLLVTHPANMIILRASLPMC
ncbi:P-loop containing nucleoside triphosphate hydrolase protein, partial [Aureobasidium melanogenum]